MKNIYVHIGYLLIIGVIIFLEPIYQASLFNKAYYERAVDEIIQGKFKTEIALKLVKHLDILKGKSIEEVNLLLDGIHSFQNFDKTSRKYSLIMNYTEIKANNYNDEENKKRFYWYSMEDKLCDLLLQFKDNKLVSFEYIKGP